MQDLETQVICVWNEQGESEEKVKSCVCGAMSKLSFLKSLKKSHLGLLTMIELDGDKVGPNNFGYFYKIATTTLFSYLKNSQILFSISTTITLFFFSNELWKLRIKTKPNKQGIE